MQLFKSLSFSLVLLIADYARPAEADLIPRAIQKAHTFAAKRTHTLARDLRVAFGGVLVSRDDTISSTAKRVVYCKPKQVPFGVPTGGGTSGGNGTTSAHGSPSTSASGTKTATSIQPSATVAVPDSPWKLQQSYSGNSFFQGWDFFTNPDPTNGIVDYVDEATAQSNGLLEVNDRGNAVMRVETTPKVDSVRKSVRITTQFQYNGALVIMDSVHMPTGCGSWPAFWSNGPNWPDGGEIDIIEGVNDYTNNQATIHTKVGCTIPSTSQNVLSITGNVIGLTDCAAANTGNQGCGIRASANNSFGAAFNTNGGGIYAMRWDSTGVAVYFFPRGSEPADIIAGKPQPDSWGAAQARWPATSCDPFGFFNNHHAIFDTTLCGDWAAGVWSATGIPGQDQSCAQRTGFSTCEDFVRASGSAFSEAYWEVKSMNIYQLQN
ncbi:glycoside hydrolase family 16 protein [Macrolepiota fuliginosa MF-IS2]|uniref:Glycoside hydrolase family 16 protein n=1 Tax=Macrolepiota fuliginosa MF-IS2 TaxID=1400762 RepID=A0A9P5XNW4_9AGAR|nr:glycoside hydrolase family 16 protein [Macrolepiota fuliginosa MF-IS2]